MQMSYAQLHPYLTVTHPEVQGNTPLCQEYY